MIASIADNDNDIDFDFDFDIEYGIEYGIKYMKGILTNSLNDSQDFLIARIPKALTRGEIFMFSFEYFKMLLKKAYEDSNTDMSYEDTEAIFNYYFTTYEKTFNKPHKNLRLETIKNIIQRLSYCERFYNKEFDLDLESYKIMIDKHFKTQYYNCDYSINHFMSGDIRVNRFYETCY